MQEPVRNFSMKDYWEHIASTTEPSMKFKGNTHSEWKQWRAEALPILLNLLGDFPEKTPLLPEIEYSVEENGLIRERVIFNSEEFMSVPCHILKRKDMKPDGSNPAILCSHGHGRFGKDPVSGFVGSEGAAEDIERMNYNYAEQMAREGFLTISPDLRGFGERRDGEDPFPGRDPCNVNFIKGAMLGIYTLTLNIWDMRRCIDYLETRPEVAADRIGMMGLSQGGTMTAFTSAVEPRIKAADIICYVNPWLEFGIRRANFCGSQMVPGIYRYFDTDEIAGLTAPRPLLIEMGIYDACFPLQDTVKGFEGVREIYRAAGAEENLYSEIFAGGHAFAGGKAPGFFKKYL